MKKIFFPLFSILFLSISLFPLVSRAQADLGQGKNSSTTDLINTSAVSPELADAYYRAKVTKILQDGQEEVDGQTQTHQKIEVEILNGDKQGEKITIDHGGSFEISPYQKVAEGEIVILAHPPRTLGAIRDVYYVVDKYRLPTLLYLVVLFFALAVYFGRRRGFTAILGLIFSILIIFYFIIPKILSGGDPLKICLAGSLMLLFVSLYLSHGFNKRTSIALLSSVLSLVLAVVVDLLFVYFAKLSGAGTEEAFYLQVGSLSFNLKGILLGGIILGVLGVLDDVTTGQVASVEEIHLANSNFKFAELYSRGLSVGREHIASLVNTLVLAYVGASFPLLLLYNSQKLQPFWLVVNSNFMAEEIVRTLVGSVVLVVAVPLTTFLAATFYSNKK